MFSSIAFAIWLKQISDFILIYLLGIISLGILTQIFLVVKGKKDRVTINIGRMILIFLLFPSKSVVNLLIDESISAKIQTDLSDKSWSIINKAHSEINK